MATMKKAASAESVQLGRGVTARREDGALVLVLPCDDGWPSKSGRMTLCASTGGFTRTGDLDALGFPRLRVNLTVGS